jgi:drug/metabolite transporter (DMT)-like permease
MNYAKALAAIIATVLSGVVAALTLDETITPAEWINVAILAAGAAGVFAAPNVPGSRYTKAVLAVITAMLTLAVQLLVDGTLDLTDWLQLGVAALGALGVYAVPNSGVSDDRYPVKGA